MNQFVELTLYVVVDGVTSKRELSNNFESENLLFECQNLDF